MRGLLEESYTVGAIRAKSFALLHIRPMPGDTGTPEKQEREPMVPTETVAAPVETAKYPGTLMAIDGNTAVVLVETAASEAAGSYPISPSSQMGEGFADAMAKGELNAFGKPL